MEAADLSDLKNTLNLPQTDFPMRAGLVESEPTRIDHWEAKFLYQAIQKKNASRPAFILHDGPPFANGDVHIGTALNKILKDTILRYKSMRGYRTPYVPGWDCHGLPIEHKVTQQMRKEKRDLSTAELRKECAEFAEGFIATQREQFRRLGPLTDWNHIYKTKDPSYEARILKTFAQFVRKGLVYRSKKPIYWSIPCKTALAEAEIEYHDHTSNSVYVAFHVASETPVNSGKPFDFLIWTTTPWTLPANQAIAVHPEFDYQEVHVGDRCFVLAKELAESVSQLCGFENPRFGAVHKGRDLEHIQAAHPFIDRPSPVVLADYVTDDSGTGCVHTAPGHGVDDYHTGRKYDLPVYSPVTDEGTFADDGQLPAQLVGLSLLPKGGKISEGNQAVLEILENRGALVFHNKYSHQYPYCWRSKTPVIYRAMDQWFIAMDKDGLREKALAAIKDVKWTPDWAEKRMQGSLESRPDWCISRQRSWGVPLPAFFTEDGRALMDADVIDALAEKIAIHGTDLWYTASAEELLEGIQLPEGFDSKTLKTGMDTLDVWIDSGCSHRAVLQDDPSLEWPADVYFEGSDQHRGWFQSSLWTGMIADNAAPYKQVITHGFVVGEDKRKISKSDGKPQNAADYVKRFGADILRLWICSEDYRNDIPISEGILKQTVQAYRTIRNTLRFQIGNLHDFDASEHTIAPENMLPLDRWALQKLHDLVTAVTEDFEEFAFHKAYQRINRFCAVTLSATYHDILKDRLYTYAPNWQERRSAQTAIYEILHALLRLLAPILTFTADEAFNFLQSGEALGEDSIHLQSWPEAKSAWKHKDAAAELDAILKVRDSVNESIEKARQQKLVGQPLDAHVTITVKAGSKEQTLLEKHQSYLEEYFIVSKVTLIASDSAESLSVATEHAGGVRCPRSWRWVDELVPLEGTDHALSARCHRALSEMLSLS